MMQDFKQLYSPMTYFRDGMKERWNLVEYRDINAPAVFLCVHDQRDIDTFVRHRGPKILYFAGIDARPERIEAVKNTSDTYCIGWSPWIIDKLRDNDLFYKEFNLPLKNYTDFKPTPLGDKIYVYKGMYGDRQPHYKWDEIVVPLIEHYGRDKIIYTERQPFETLINDYYKKCFVYIKPNPQAGSTAMWELGYMGRKTISVHQGGLPHVLESNNDVDTIIKLINEESKKIGTIQTHLANQVHNKFMNNNEWLYLDFWKK